MDSRVIRTPRPAPEPQPPAPPPTPPGAPPPQYPPSRPAYSRQTSSRSASSRPAHSKPTYLKPPSSPPPHRPRQTLEVRLCQLVHEVPRLQTLRLIPVDDSTAFIKDRMLLKSPGLAADGNALPMRMGYLVGWHDLRGASVLVPAGDVLDYVSPYALEQFEYGLWKERRREEKEAAEQRSGAAENGTQAHTGAQEAQVATVKRGRPGRPRKKKRRAPGVSLEVPVDEGAILEEARKRAGSQVREGQPSLSTPQKGRAMKFVGVGDDEADAEADAAIYRQLCGDRAETSYPVTSEQESRDSDSEPPRKRMKSSSSSSPTKDAGLGTGRTSDRTTPVPRQTHIRAYDSSSRPILEPRGDVTPTRTSFTPVVPPKAVRQAHATAPSADTEGNMNSLSSQRPTKPPPKPRKPSKTPRKKPPGANTPAPRNGAGSRDPGPNEEPVEDVQFVVDSLEGMKRFKIDGKLERFFLVRWEGNWAPEDNPTWEPEENIPPALVKRYLKNPRRTAATAAAPKKNVWPTRRYSTVMEAFEDSGLTEGAINGVSGSNDEDEDDMDEEMFQVTEGMGEEGPTGSSKPSSEFLSRELGLAFGRGFGMGGASSR